VARRAITADGVATAVSVLGAERGMKFLRIHTGPDDVRQYRMGRDRNGLRSLP
jgi:thiamine biosynthesis lipoprotein ApbE